jgi:hypothetical protein
MPCKPGRLDMPWDARPTHFVRSKLLSPPTEPGDLVDSTMPLGCSLLRTANGGGARSAMGNAIVRGFWDIC